MTMHEDAQKMELPCTKQARRRVRETKERLETAQRRILQSRLMVKQLRSELQIISDQLRGRGIERVEKDGCLEEMPKFKAA